MSVLYLAIVISIVTPVATLRLGPPEEITEPLGYLTSADLWAKSVAAAGYYQRREHEPSKFKCSQLHKPSTEPYSLARKNIPEEFIPSSYWSQIKQDRRIAPFFQNRTGFFIESGAADGETNSNSLHFEMNGWTGLLVEPNPLTFPTTLSKHRKAYLYNGGLSITGEPGKMYLMMKDQISKLVEESAKSQPNVVQVELAPISDLLGCIGQTTVDFWSLDVEGVESEILSSFPFEKVEVGLMLIEISTKSIKNQKEVPQIMEQNGFQECGSTKADKIYVNPKYFEKRGLETPREC